jgi:hypothetical protein
MLENKIISSASQLERPEVQILFDGLEKVVGFRLDDNARLDISSVLQCYWFHPSGGVPYVDYRRIITAYIRRASAMSETRDLALLLADEIGLMHELSPPSDLDGTTRPSRAMAPLYQLPIREPRNLTVIKDLISVLDRVDELTALMTPELLDLHRSGKTPIEFRLKLAEFKRDVAEGKERVLEQFPTLQWLFDEILNEPRLRDALRGVVLAREPPADDSIPRRGERRRRRKPRNWKMIAVQMGLRKALESAAERSEAALRTQDFDNFLQCMNMLSPREWNFGTAQATRDVMRQRVKS